MKTMAAWSITVTLAVVAFLPLQSALLLQSKLANGQCVMYGQCGINPETQKSVPCVYHGPAKPLTDAKGRQLLQELCPNLAHEKSTCCDLSQLEELHDSMVLVSEVLELCPACLHNFRNIFCYMLCSPKQSLYLRINNTYSSKVLAVDYDISSRFVTGMFSSCKDVRIPSATGKALGILCGHPAAKCTPKNWLEYIGSTENGAAFSINFNLSIYSAGHPMDAQVIPCSSPADGGKACSCQDCSKVPCVTTPSPQLPIFPCTNTSRTLNQYRETFWKPGYQPIQMVIQRRGKHPPIRHNEPPPSLNVIFFNAVFNKTFLHQVLNLTEAIQAMNVTLNKVNFTLDHVCLRGNGSKQCTIPSVLQYFQRSHTNINKIAIDSFGFFILEDYLDHLSFCFRYPYVTRENLPLNMSCIADYGGVVAPYDVLCGYQGNRYANSTALVVTFVIKDPRVSIPGAVWRNGLVKLAKAYNEQHKDVLLKIYQPFLELL